MVAIRYEFRTGRWPRAQPTFVLVREGIFPDRRQAAFIKEARLAKRPIHRWLHFPGSTAAAYHDSFASLGTGAWRPVLRTVDRLRGFLAGRDIDHMDDAVFRAARRNAVGDFSTIL
jgi:hypothetical protein